MRPRRILTREETVEILEQAAAENALCVLTTHDGAQWHTFKSRMLERDPGRKFVVLDYRETHGKTPPPVAPGQYVGISFRSRNRKVMFASVVEARGRYHIEGQESVPAVRYRWPETLTELQRRAYYRTPVPPQAAFAVSLWAGGVIARAQAQSEPLASFSGRAADLSCGGMFVRLSGARTPDWHIDQTLGAELHVPDGRAPVLLDAYFRGIRCESDGRLGVAIQFVGLELSDEGRAVLQRIAHCVQKMHRITGSNGAPDANRSANSSETGRFSE